MDNQQASLKVIEDLQKVLFRMVTTTSKNKNSGGDETSRKLEIINSRLLSLDMKVDTKPGYPQTLAIGVAAGALLQRANSVLPRVVSGVLQIWSSVGRVANASVSSD
ncbi:hypothetical protein LIER_17537 [Lithospermum erythrorhizon]|uniref:Uncharacterized protein n=1 Tax=Lithospermum erythrorhizon TaxID=34254 RepID=A0AAV3QD87_LITER